MSNTKMFQEMSKTSNKNSLTASSCCFSVRLNRVEWSKLKCRRKRCECSSLNLARAPSRSFSPPTRLSFSLSASSACRPLSSMSLRLTNCTSLSFDYTSKSSLSRLRRIYQEATSPFEENIEAQRRADAQPKPFAWHYNDFQNNLPLCWWRSSMANNYSK